MSLSHLGERNYRWKGDDVGYIALHQWIKRRLPMPKKCPICEIRTPYDLANIAGKYNRDFENWEYLCHRCHMIFDNGGKKRTA